MHSWAERPTYLGEAQPVLLRGDYLVIAIGVTGAADGSRCPLSDWPPEIAVAMRTKGLQRGHVVSQ